jgi:uncharacterized coiled-coil protein SlyX
MPNQPEPTLDARVTRLEGRVTHLEGMTEVVTAVRADVATIAAAIDPNLTQHVAELEARAERHALLLGRLLEVTPLARPRENDED